MFSSDKWQSKALFFNRSWSTCTFVDIIDVFDCRLSGLFTNKTVLCYTDVRVLSPAILIKLSNVKIYDVNIIIHFETCQVFVLSSAPYKIVHTDRATFLESVANPVCFRWIG